jgi:hypothetical protein
MDENRIIEQTEETALVTKTEENAIAPSFVNSAPTMWNDLGLMKMAMQTAKILAGSTAVPDAYKGKPGDCMIAIDLSNRMGISPISVMQFSQVVKGNFTWKGQACKALVDGNGKFTGSRYVMFGKPGTDDWGCRLEATNKITGDLVVGPEVTIKMAKDEGWYDKNGSKWKTMPDLMLRYRAAAFFARTECPESLMGFYTSEEMNDIKCYETNVGGNT